MAGTITRIAYQKKNRQRANIYLDGAYAFALPDIEAARLKIGQYLGDDEIADLRIVDDKAKAYDRALRLLGHRPRSHYEIERRLQQAGYPQPIVAATLKRLQDQGYVDDEAFVRWWLENRARFRPRGRRALRQELRQKGVDNRLIDAALSTIDEDEQALQAGRKRLRRWQHLGEEAFYQKMLGYLQRQGFGYQVARAATQQLWHEVVQGEP